MDDRSWANSVLAKLDAKMTYGVQKAQTLDGIPYTVQGSEWKSNGIGWWTNGFWPAEMWQMYLATGKELYRAEALRAETLMDEAFKNFTRLHHDVGFLWLINSGVHYALDGNADSLTRMLFAGNILAGRYNPNGFIRAWNDNNDGARAGWSIIDTMMNLPLLYTMSAYTHDPRFALMAKSHADHVIQNFFKPDGSVYHIVCYNAETGAIEDTPAGQGCAPGSSWSRGQSWAMYGFMLSYLHTGDRRYIAASRRVSDYFLSHMPEDMLAPVDFCQSAEPHLIDNCANGIAACGLIELAKAIQDEAPEAAESYMNAARALLRALDEHCADWTEKTPAVLTHCTSAYHDEAGHHIAMDYGDYFFIEGVRKLAGETRLFWKPLDFAK